MTDPNDHDRFVLRQKLKLVINQYAFSASPGEGDDGEPFCFVEQKRFKFKEDIRFFEDEGKSRELLRILARQRFDPTARYDVTAGGVKVGEIQKVFGKSLLRSTFTLFGPDGAEVATVRERSLPVALFRRLVGFVPYLGNFADWLPIPYDFEFLRGEERIGINRRRRWKWVDVYDIDLSGDPQRTLDRRLVLAIAVGSDALMAR
ncbi:hypothetical protein PAI11_32710 [Patulibacter medicamentivorans]|uniref:Uncharacterized protein n=1 Tax=Patulibacter medicamentivorans TaxID=1097667 RepID=H0E8V7_9ACTN|nr:hypothetical protein [Patulibacter medicamentivorans]EHN09912.1 hypothetical protein PAI11_32710 [Patulibacter medicamentivorans]